MKLLKYSLYIMFAILSSSIVLSLCCGTVCYPGGWCDDMGTPDTFDDQWWIGCQDATGTAHGNNFKLGDCLVCSCSASDNCEWVPKYSECDTDEVCRYTEVGNVPDDSQCWGRDSDESYCTDPIGCGGSAYNWAKAGELDVDWSAFTWEYAYGQTNLDECCGDDSKETYVTVGNGADRCCYEGNNCVDSGNICRGEWGTEVTCDDGIDNDCDGLPDCQDPDCATMYGPDNKACCQSPNDCLQNLCVEEQCNSNQCEYNPRDACDSTECDLGSYCDSSGGDCKTPDESSDVCLGCFDRTPGFPDTTSSTWGVGNHTDAGVHYGSIYFNSNGGPCTNGCYDSSGNTVNHEPALTTGLCCGNDANEYSKPDYNGPECVNDANDCVWYDQGDSTQSHDTGSQQAWCYEHEWYYCESTANIGNSVATMCCAGTELSYRWTTSTQLQNESAYSCYDNIDGDCDGLVDFFDSDCGGCPTGTRVCRDGSCQTDCLAYQGDPPDIDNDNCDLSETCANSDCWGDEANCIEGARCDGIDNVCSCQQGTSLCVDTTCQDNCSTHGGLPSFDENDVCEFGEGCNSPDCYGLKGPCYFGGICDSEDQSCKCGFGTRLCGDFTCQKDCTLHDDDPPSNNDGTCDANETCGHDDCFGDGLSCPGGMACDSGSKSCKCKLGNTLCFDGTCQTDCTDNGGNKPYDIDNECDEGEPCLSSDCYGLEGPCPTGAMCDSARQTCACGYGTSLCKDGTCQSDCGTHGGFPDFPPADDGNCEPGEGCHSSDCWPENLPDPDGGPCSEGSTCMSATKTCLCLPFRIFCYDGEGRCKLPSEC